MCYSTTITNLFSIFRNFRQQLHNRGVKNIEAQLEKEFPAWFKKHVSNLVNAPEDLKSLALSPDARVVVHHMCNVNGARFRSVEREKNMRTQNSGIM